MNDLARKEKYHFLNGKRLSPKRKRNGCKAFFENYTFQDGMIVYGLGSSSLFAQALKQVKSKYDAFKSISITINGGQ